MIFARIVERELLLYCACASGTHVVTSGDRPTMYTVLYTSTALALAYAAFLFLRPKASREPSSRPKKLPPGPPPHFLVGHTFQVPQTRPWLYFDELGKNYGMTGLH